MNSGYSSSGVPLFNPQVGVMTLLVRLFLVAQACLSACLLACRRDSRDQRKQSDLVPSLQTCRGYCSNLFFVLAGASPGREDAAMD